MDYHTSPEADNNIDVLKFEFESMNKIGLINQIPPRYRSAYFQHSMTGGYTAGYYSYIWPKCWMQMPSRLSRREGTFSTRKLPPVSEKIFLKKAVPKMQWKCIVISVEGIPQLTRFLRTGDLNSCTRNFFSILLFSASSLALKKRFIRFLYLLIYCIFVRSLLKT